MKKYLRLISLIMVIGMLSSTMSIAATVKTSTKADYYRKASTTKSNKSKGKIRGGTKINALSYVNGFVKFKNTKGTFYIKLDKVTLSGVVSGTVAKTAYSYKADLKTKAVKFNSGMKIAISKLIKKNKKQYFYINNQYFMEAKFVKISSFETPIVTATPTVEPTPEPNATPGVQYIGRFDMSDSKKITFGWSGSTIRARFQGTEISGTFSAPSAKNWLEVVVDGKTLTPIRITAEVKEFKLASGLSDGIHIINVIKRTEGGINGGEVYFHGFNYGTGHLLAPIPVSSKKIEFIGDSITCGYGNEGTNPNQSFLSANENFNKTYAALTAKALYAEQQTVAISGWGVTTHAPSGGKVQTQYGNTYYSSTAKWDFNEYQPQAVVINLCTNDMRGGTLPTKTEFQAGYNEMLDLVRSKHPSAKIFCCVGPMLSGDGLYYSTEYINDIVKTRNTAGDKNVYLFKFDQQDIAQNGVGDDYHPSIKTHEIMAKKLIPFIKSKLGW